MSDPHQQRNTSSFFLLLSCITSISAPQSLSEQRHVCPFFTTITLQAPVPAASTCALRCAALTFGALPKSEVIATLAPLAYCNESPLNFTSLAFGRSWRTASTALGLTAA